MPIRQVDDEALLSLAGDQHVGEQPAPSPRTIQAMMPMTDSLVSDVRGMRITW